MASKYTKTQRTAYQAGFKAGRAYERRSRKHFRSYRKSSR